MDWVTDIEIECPYCGGLFMEKLDTSQGNQELITDCNVCCRPIELSVECRAGEVVSVRVDR